MLPAALVITAVCDGRDGVRRLLGGVVQWRLERGRFGWRSWLLAMVALPALTLLLGALLGGTMTVDPGQLARDLGSVASALILIHLAEETVLAGFVQSRIAPRTGVVRAALLTAVPFAAIHLPLTLIGPVTARSVLLDAGGLLLLAVVLRLLIGVLLDRTGGSILAAATAHATFNAANNSGGLVDHLLSGVDQGLVAPGAGLLLVAALLLSTFNHTKG
jgi:membrane protease YdiL (CAAX protease family)